MGPQPPEARKKPQANRAAWFGATPAPAAPAEAQAAPQPRPGRASSRAAWFGAEPAADVAESPISTPKESPGILGYATQSVAKTALGKDLGDAYDQIVNSVHASFPKEYGESYATKFTESLLRMAPEMGDFAASPVGMGLIAAHFWPPSAPFAVGADFLLGGYQMLKTIPSIANAVEDPGDPVKVAEAVKDIGYSFMARKATSVAARETSLSSLTKTRPLEARNVINELRTADPADKLAVATRLAAPKTPKEKLFSWAYNTPFLKTFSAIMDVPKPKLMESAAYLVDDRNNAIGSAELSVAKLVHDFKKEVPAAERDVKKMGYVIEGSMTADQAGLSPAARKWVGKIREWNNTNSKWLDEAYGGDVKLHDPETYLMHKWGFADEGEMANKGGALSVGRRMIRDPQLRARVIGTYKEGIEQHGFTPMHDDIADLLTARHRMAATAVANQRISNTLTSMGLMVSEQDARKLGIEKSWPQLESKPLERSVYGGRRASGEAIFRTRPVRVHPDVKMPVEAIFGEGVPLRDPITGKRTWQGSLEYLRAFGKQQAVGFSLFHNWAISEQSQAVHMGTNPGLKGITNSVKNTFLFNGEWYKGMKSGLWEVRKKGTPNTPPVLGLKHSVALDWVNHGLRLGTSDAEGAVVKAMQKTHFDNAALDKTVGAVNRQLGNIHYIANRGLWDFYLPGQMMLASDTIFTNEMRIRPRTNPEEIAALKYEITKHVNKVFGTESMESMLLHPRFRFWANFALFAPVWTFSNFRVLTNGFQSEASHKLTGRWVGGAAFTWFVTSNMANYAMTNWVYSGQEGPMPDRNGDRRGHFMWDNPGAPVKMGGKYTWLSENSAHIAAGYNPDGTEKYIRFGKGFMEPIMALMDPRAYLAGKTGLIPKTAIAMYSGHEPGTGYEVVDPNLPLAKQAEQYGMIASELVAPFVSQDLLRKTERYLFPDIVPEGGSSQATLPGTPIPLGLPARKGINALRALNAYEEAINDHRPDVAENIMKTAELNHIPRSRILAAYRDRLRKKKHIEQGPRNRYDEYGSAQPPSAR